MRLFLPSTISEVLSRLWMTGEHSFRKFLSSSAITLKQTTPFFAWKITDNSRKRFRIQYYLFGKCLSLHQCTDSAETEFLDVIGTKVLLVFLLAFHSLLYKRKERKKERKIVYFLNTALTYRYHRQASKHGIAIFFKYIAI